MRRLLASLAVSSALLAFGATGCAASQQHVEVMNDIHIVITPAVDVLPFDPRGSRLRAATDQLTRLAGHPIVVQVDAALAKELRADFEHQLISAIEMTVQDLAILKKTTPAVFERQVAAFKRLECHYSAATEEPMFSFDRATGIVRIDLPPKPKGLVPRRFVGAALVMDDELERQRRFGTKMPDAISPAEWREYFDYLVPSRSGTEWSFARFYYDRDRVARMAQMSKSDVLVRTVRLHALVKGDPELSSRIRTWLLEQIDAAETQTAYGPWLASEWPRASRKEKIRLSEKLFEPLPESAYPGVDRFGLGLGLLEESLGPDGEEARKTLLNTHRGWLRLATSTDGNRRKLAHALGARNDGALAEAVFGALRETGARDRGREGEDAYTEIFHLIPPTRGAWRVAVDVLAVPRERRLEREAAYIWKTYPDKRGSAIYLRAVNGKEYLRTSHEETYWREFPRSFGAAIDGAVLGGMLDHGSTAFELAPMVWPGLAPGFSRMGVVIPRLSTLLPDTTSPDAERGLRALSVMVDKLCKESNASDLAMLHTYLKRRIASQPREARSLAILERDTAQGGCRARTKTPREEEP